MLVVEYEGRGEGDCGTAESRFGGSGEDIGSLSMAADRWLELRGLLDDAADARGVGVDVADRGGRATPAAPHAVEPGWSAIPRAAPVAAVRR